MGLRQIYEQIEKVATPIAEQIVGAEEFAKATSLVGGLNKAVRAELHKRTAQAWHVVNLPAGTDVQRLRRQVGELDREVRLLTLELQRQRRRKGVAGDAEHD